MRRMESASDRGLGSASGIPGELAPTSAPGRLTACALWTTRWLPSAAATALCFYFLALRLLRGVMMRRRWPAFTAVCLVYAITPAPVLGFFHNGPQAVADRYSYLARLGLALLLGAAAARLLTTCAGPR